MRRFLALVVALAALPATGGAAADPFPGVASAYLVEVDGRTLWSRAAHAPLAPASLTKMMTALLITEADGFESAVTVVSRVAAAATGSRLELRAGDRMRMPDLLAAALIASANDACRALAEWRDGNEARFVVRMNARAAQLGLVHSRFRNACGHDAPGHVSTAADLARLARIVMDRPAVSAEVRRVERDLSTVDGHRQFRLSNRNALIGRYEGAIGVKSGFTARAGPCVVAIAQRRGVQVLLVLLNGRERWWDAHRILDRAFDHVARR